MRFDELIEKEKENYGKELKGLIILKVYLKLLKN